ncbi:MAG: hypothetical protein M5T61_05200 [Acidimicrobiia bacterium]|nr:hypothetical protein [Acidimicrobiia bacterium]
MNPDNPFVLRAQVACAAHELPLEPSDDSWFGEGLDDVVRDLVHDDLLVPRAGKMYWAGREAPAAKVGLRTGSSAEYRLIDIADGHTIGTVDDARVFSVAHPGAVYLHQGRQYRVDDLDTADHVALLEAFDDADEYTQPRSESDLVITGEDRSEAAGPGAVHLGSVEVTSRVAAYQRKQISDNRVIEVCDLDLPPRTLPTRACWYTVPLPRSSNPDWSPPRCSERFTQPSTG